MKIIINLLLVFSISNACQAQAEFQYKNLIVIPAKPHPGDRVRFIYDPKNTPLADLTSIEVSVQYATPTLDDKAGFVTTQLLKKTDKGWEGSFVLYKKLKVVGLSFSNHPLAGDNNWIYDNNNANTYVIPVFDQKNKMLKGAWFDLAYIPMHGNWVGGKIKADSLIVKYLNNGKKINGLYNDTVAYCYYRGLSWADNNKYKLVVENWLTDKMKKGLHTEKAYNEMIFKLDECYLHNLSDSLAVLCIKAYPNGEKARFNRLSKLFDAKPFIIDSLMYAFNKYDSFLHSQNLSKKEIDSLPSMQQFTFIISRGLGQAERWKEFYQWLPLNNQYSIVAIYKQVIDDLLAKNKISPQLEKAAEEALLRTHQFINDTNKLWLPWNKLILDEQVKEDRTLNYALAVGRYAEILLKSGKTAMAKKEMAEVMKITNGRDKHMNELNLDVLIAAGDTSLAVLAKAENCLKQGMGTLAMKDNVKKLYLANNRPPLQFEKYFDTLNNYTEFKLRDELKKIMVNEPAPDFVLKNLNGDQVTLSAFKGSPVVVDFWATWCGPCKASFPAMTKAIANIKDNNINASFLFIDTWEDAYKDNETGRHKEVADFITSHNYPFNVLLDQRDSTAKFATVTAYNVIGIPAKFIINSKGNIRFKLTGGDEEDKTIREIALMIKMADEDN